MKNEKTISANEMADLQRDDNAIKEVEKTIMSTDQSLIAWVRTGISLISFGFTLYTFLSYTLEQLKASGNDIQVHSSPRIVGLFMVGMGILCLVFGIIENIYTTKGLRKKYDIRRPRLALLMAGMLAFFSIVLLLGIIFRVKGM